jgi:hypothetical protein
MTGTIVEITIPSEQFALEHTPTEGESVTFEVEQIVATNDESVMSLFGLIQPIARRSKRHLLRIRALLTSS